MVKDPNAQAEKMYQQLLELLEEMSSIYADAGEGEEDEDDGVAVDIDDVIDGLVEEGVERGLDEETTERVFKAVKAFAEKAAEA